MTQDQDHQPTAVIADVDTGVDDALALMFLARNERVRLKAVTCVAGNTHVDQVVRNTLNVLDVAGASSVPVGRGAERPLINRLRTAHGFHGSNGLGELLLPRSSHSPSPLPAIELMRKTVDEADEPLTLLALGPLTNVALFIRVHPEHASRLARIVFMGGSGGPGNASPVAEFNAWHDPEALAIVLESGIPITMYGLDVFHQANVVSDDYLPLLESPDPGTRLVGQLLEYAAFREADESRLLSGATIGDAGAACLVANGQVVHLQELPVSVVLYGTSRGQTVVDRRSKSGESELHGQAAEAHTIKVATAIDPDLMRQTFLSAVSGVAAK